MAKSANYPSGVFPMRVRKRLHRLLKSESIEGYWAAGRILNEHFGERAAYGEMPKIEAELKSLGDAATSLSQLHQCRRLHATWSKKDMAAATRTGLPWGRAIVLISIWGEGKKRNRPELIERCKTLIAEFHDLDRKSRKGWESKLNTLRKRARSGDVLISTRRLLGEKKAAVILRLTAASNLIEEMREFLPTKEHSACTRLSALAEVLSERVTKLCKKYTVNKPDAE